MIKEAASVLKGFGGKFLYVSSFDEYLSEYVPVEDSLRSYLSGFTGSVAEAILTSEGVLYLFVDGRYYEQADRECPGDEVVVVKVPYGTTLKDAMFEWIKERLVSDLFIVGERTPEALKRDLDKSVHVYSLDTHLFFKKIGFQPLSLKGEIESLAQEYCGEKSLSKCMRLIKSDDAYFISALDTLAWITNTRSFHIPYQSTYRAVGLAMHDGVKIFTDCSLKAGHQLEESVTLYRFDQWGQVCGDMKNIKRVFWDKGATTVSHFKKLQETFPNSVLGEKDLPFACQWHALKNDREIDAFKESFRRSDRAIFNSFMWLKDQVEKGHDISEKAFSLAVKSFYKDEGAYAQSFSTIAGFGAHSSIIHYSRPSETTLYKAGENVLLDSGAFFAGGLSTDCTRTMCLGEPSSEEQKKYYTLVLKSLLTLLNLKFKKGTTGVEIDEIARRPIVEAGYNYAHGTGHGIGVNVHEAGYGISPYGVDELRIGTVGSLEPGLYIEGVGGVRLENVAIVRQDPDREDQLCFENLIYIGFCHELIDESMLSEQELRWLNNYEKLCLERGCSFRE